MLEVINESRIEQLECLLEVVAKAIDDKPGARDLAQLSKQYREILKELEDIQGMVKNENEIENILEGRRADGKSSAIRKSSS